MSTTDKHASAGPPSTKKETSDNDKNGGASSVPLSVNQATHNDIPDICTLYKKVWDEFKGKIPAQLEHTWQPTPLEFTSQMEGVHFFAARRDRKLVGILGCSEEDGAVRIVHMAVDPELRHQGVGIALLSQGLEWARRSGSTSMWVEAMTHFTPAIALFRKAGFKEIGMFHRHLWKEDVMLLELVL